MQEYSIIANGAGQEEAQEAQRQNRERRRHYRRVLRDNSRRVLAGKTDKLHNKRLQQTQQLLRTDHAGPVHLRREGYHQPHVHQLHQRDIHQSQPAAVDGRSHFNEVRFHLRELVPQ